MKITYILTDKEIDFLKEISEFQPAYMWSYQSKYDKFREEYGEQIKEFFRHGLLEKKDGGHYTEYIKFGLNDRGLELVEHYKDKICQ